MFSATLRKSSLTFSSLFLKNNGQLVCISSRFFGAKQNISPEQNAAQMNRNITHTNERSVDNKIRKHEAAEDDPKFIVSKRTGQHFREEQLASTIDRVVLGPNGEKMAASGPNFDASRKGLNRRPGSRSAGIPQDNLTDTTPARVYYNSSHNFSIQNKLAATIRQLTNNGLPQTVLAPAGAGAFRVPKGSPIEKKDFMDFTGNVGSDDTSRVKQKEDEMNKAAAEATKRIHKEDEAQIRDRIDNIGGKKKKDSAYKAAKEAGEGNLQSKEGVKEQYQKWTDKVDKTGEPAYNRLRDAESSAQEKGYDWAKKAEPPKHRENEKGFVEKVKEKVQHVMGKK